MFLLNHLSWTIFKTSPSNSEIAGAVFRAGWGLTIKETENVSTLASSYCSCHILSSISFSHSQKATLPAWIHPMSQRHML
jgi:hypothetical protein